MCTWRCSLAASSSTRAPASSPWPTLAPTPTAPSSSFAPSRPTGTCDVHTMPCRCLASGIGLRLRLRLRLRLCMCAHFHVMTRKLSGGVGDAGSTASTLCSAAWLMALTWSRPARPWAPSLARPPSPSSSPTAASSNCLAYCLKPAVNSEPLTLISQQAFRADLSQR